MGPERKRRQMSSPLARQRSGLAQQVAADIHQRFAHSRRLEQLAGLLAGVIRAEAGVDGAACLDVGCGDMRLAELLGASIPGSIWTCVDVHPLPPGLAADPRWSKYREFDGRTLPFPDNAFAVALFCDVLHHAPADAQPALLAESLRVARKVVVKDHFEYGPMSRMMLRAMDFAGNWGYGVPVPERYFSEASYLALLGGVGCRETTRVHPISLYGHIPLGNSILRPEWQFISVLRAA